MGETKSLSQKFVSGRFHQRLVVDDTASTHDMTRPSQFRKAVRSLFRAGLVDNSPTDSPQPLRDRKRIGSNCFPPGHFVTYLVVLPVVRSA
jgi:hypothetical protein